MIMSDTKITRRRMLSIAAAAAGGTALFGRSAAAAPAAHRWRGLALGAEADLTLYAANRAEAMEALAACLKELARLEAIFSLHQPDSALATLNAKGSIDEPPQELVVLLAQALDLARQSGGLFDPTIQPLWEAVAAHFRTSPSSKPEPGQFDEARSRVDYRGVALSPARIAFRRPGMRVTLNGMAQGFISDKVAELLAARGFAHALVNLGEAAATGPRPDGSAWSLDIPDPRDRSRSLARVGLSGGAVATSSGAGLVFDKAGRFTHILNPHRLTSAPCDRSVTVLAPSGSLADGLSTFATLVDEGSDAFAVLLRSTGSRALIVPTSGSDARWIGEGAS